MNANQSLRHLRQEEFGVTLTVLQPGLGDFHIPEEAFVASEIIMQRSRFRQSLDSVQEDQTCGIDGISPAGGVGSRKRGR
jgi:hypothetical protein